MSPMSMIATHLAAIQTRIKDAAIASGRPPESVRLVAVSKTKPMEAITEAHATGQIDFGENYIQEAVEKIDTLTLHDVRWHFIGHLQRNKAKYAVPRFDLIHGVDSMKLVAELSKQAAKLGKVQEILVQIHTGEEESKSGVAPEAAVNFIREAAGHANVRITGLMTIPPPCQHPEDNRPHFRQVRTILEDVNALGIEGLHLTELSMGMTDDFEVAVEEGATLVRVGTAIFGARNYAK